MMPGATQEEQDMARELMGLSGGYLERLWHYVSGAFFRLDLGRSYQTGSVVTADLLARFPRTLMLAVVSMILAVVIGMPLGIAAALNHNSLGDRSAMLVAIFGVSMPPFWLAILLVLLFAFRLRLLPPFGIGGIQYYILPAIANCFASVAGFARQTRSSVLECIRAEYVTTVRAKGVSERSVLWSHIIPNSLIPIITYAGTQFSKLLAGAIVIENVFSIPGIGVYMVNAINKRDYGAVQGAVIFSSLVFCLLMLAVDIIYAYVDPRIKARYEIKREKRTNAA